MGASFCSPSLSSSSGGWVPGGQLVLLLETEAKKALSTSAFVSMFPPVLQHKQTSRLLQGFTIKFCSVLFHLPPEVKPHHSSSIQPPLQPSSGLFNYLAETSYSCTSSMSINRLLSRQGHSCIVSMLINPLHSPTVCIARSVLSWCKAA